MQVWARCLLVFLIGIVLVDDHVSLVIGPKESAAILYVTYVVACVVVLGQLVLLVAAAWRWNEGTAAAQAFAASAKALVVLASSCLHQGRTNVDNHIGHDNGAAVAKGRAAHPPPRKDQLAIVRLVRLVNLVAEMTLKYATQDDQMVDDETVDAEMKMRLFLDPSPSPDDEQWLLSALPTTRGFQNTTR